MTEIHEGNALFDQNLSCGCSVQFYPPVPDLGDELYCVKHDGAVTVTSKGQMSEESQKLRALAGL